MIKPTRHQKFLLIVVNLALVGYGVYFYLLPEQPVPVFLVWLVSAVAVNAIAVFTIYHNRDRR